MKNLRDAAAIPHMTYAKQSDGTFAYFFGDTCIRATKVEKGGWIGLRPVSGTQVACGEWADLEMDQVADYCELLARHLNKTEGNVVEVVIHVEGGMVQAVYASGKKATLDVTVLDLDVSDFPDDGEQEEADDKRARLEEIEGSEEWRAVW